MASVNATFRSWDYPMQLTVTDIIMSDAKLW